MKLYRYDLKTGEYTGDMEAQKRPNGEFITDVIGATTQEPPVTGEKQAARWTGSEWEVVEDHRQKRDKGGVIIDTTGTPYWLPGDTWQTPARYLTELGPLPKDALLETPAKTDEELAAEELAQAKAERADAVSKITVTVDDMTFDGDEISQERMSRTITAAVATGEDMSATTTWVLADNSIKQVSIKQLAQALRAAGEQQTKLWTVPYDEAAAEQPAEEPTIKPETVPEETTTETEQSADTEATA